MASQSALEIVKEVCSRVGIAKPNAAVGSTDIQIQQLVALANEEGQELASRYLWTALIREKTFTTIANEDQGVLATAILAAADGFDYIINDTLWNRTIRYPLPGGTPPAQWQAEKAFTTTGAYARYRIRGGHLLMLPAPAAGLTIAFEYKTANWRSNVTTDVFGNSFAADTDYPLLDSRLITLGLVWRWKASKGLQYSENFQTYEAAVADAMARDGTKKPVSMNGCGDGNFQPYVVVPLTNWPGH